MKIDDLLAKVEQPSKRKQVLDFLASKPGEAFTASQIGQHMAGMSASYCRKVLRDLLSDGLLACHLGHYYLAPAPAPNGKKGDHETA
jgi:hypothetical protein